MSGKELYELHKGKNASYYGEEGTICGYEYNLLIMSVTNPSWSGGLSWASGWLDMDEGDVVLFNKDNALGYHYVSESDIID